MLVARMHAFFLTITGRNREEGILSCATVIFSVCAQSMEYYSQISALSECVRTTHVITCHVRSI